MPLSPSLPRELRALLPADAVLTSPTQTAAYECDGLTMHRQTPAVVVLPSTSDQVAAVLRLCEKHKTPVVARGAGTGLSGGAMPLKDGVLLGMARMRRILSIDPARRRARVQPGVVNAAVSQAAAAHNLFYAPDPSSQSACTIGGNIAENAGGVHCLKYGLTVHNVAELTVATINGDFIVVGEDHPGYDFASLLIGSEGMLGVVVEAVVKLTPRPPGVEMLLAGFAEVEDCADSVADVISAGIIPAALEMMDNPAIRAAEDFAAAGYPKDAAAILLCELDGAPEDIAVNLEKTREIFRRRRAATIIQAPDAASREKLWSGRKAAFPAIGRLSPDYYCMDGTIPRRQLAATLKTIAALAKKHRLGVANVFHAGDGNLHPLIFYDANDEDSLSRAEKFGNDILRACVAVGGAVTGEHGVGVEKLDTMCAQFPPAELRQFFRLKAAFDPDSLLNPGKAIPTLARCSELGGMHVHRGRLPHPDLPRF